MTAIRFRTEDGLSLEGELREANQPPRGNAVLCHPHPRHGGSKDHPVLWALRNELAGRRRLTVLSFNFRGVMGSEGRYAGGRGEVRDVAAAVQRVRGEGKGPTVLVGWSFGSLVALRYALTEGPIEALVLLATPLATEGGKQSLPTLDEVAGFTTPVLLVAGDGDWICPVSELRNLEGWFPRGEAAVIEGADHLFGGRERELAERVGDWIDGVLEP